MTHSLELLRAALADQHRRLEAMTDTVLIEQGTQRRAAFAELCCFLAAHEAAEEECLHRPVKGAVGGDMTHVDLRLQQEDETGKLICELEGLDASSPEFRDTFTRFRLALTAHAEAEESDGLPKLGGAVDDVEVQRMREALARVPELVSRDGDSATSYTERLQAARAEFRSKSPTAR